MVRKRKWMSSSAVFLSHLTDVIYFVAQLLYNYRVFITCVLQETPKMGTYLLIARFLFPTNVVNCAMSPRYCDIEVSWHILYLGFTHINRPRNSHIPTVTAKVQQSAFFIYMIISFWKYSTPARFYRLWFM